MSRNNPVWTEQFRIQSEVDLDFVIAQDSGLPVGMTRHSPPAFRRRVLAAVISYQLGLRSIDYTLKRYVEPSLYDGEDSSLGDEASDYIRGSIRLLMRELLKLHTEAPAFGEFGAEITLYRLPHALDIARMMSNRGLLLEVLPILRLSLEMMAWAGAAFNIKDEREVISLKAQSCISEMKRFYRTVGKIYGYLSTFSHWGHVVHGRFLDFADDRAGVINASVRYRAMSLALCIVVLDAFVEVVREIYREKSGELVLGVQGALDRDDSRKTCIFLSRFVELTKLHDLREIRSLVP
jgi:hypothetical protein